MKENNKPTMMDKFAEFWDDLETGMKIALGWLFLIFVGIVTLGIIFPIFGLIMVGIVIVLGTLAAIGYILDEV